MSQRIYGVMTVGLDGGQDTNFILKTQICRIQLRI